ncbi:Uma2 family endonuclease [Prochlorothrix hollandica]|uniref:Uma2 family endonuclease n=1 Tax=Prochlorothrix hollandica TaxID=1223 RepID=UPI00333EC78E
MDSTRIDPRLPSSEDLPHCDETPVDNEDQNLLPNWLFAVLEEIWADRPDWYFAVDMAIYDREGQRRRAPTIIPDGFLALGVPRYRYPDRGRLSYVIAEENDIVPQFALEYVSHSYGGEYDQKFEIYAQLGVLYYAIYNEQQRHSRRKIRYQGWGVHRNGNRTNLPPDSTPVDPLEIYRLHQGHYERVPGDPVWMPEIGLGLGRVQGVMQGRSREWLAWFNGAGVPYPLIQEQLHQERQRADDERSARLALLAKLEAMGIDLDSLQDN